jgi:tripartite-type tricarboxylate transporter receptor subunit TctC
MGSCSAKFFVSIVARGDNKEIAMTRIEPPTLRRRSLLKALSALALPALPHASHAQLGQKPARLVVGFAAGGNGDALARALAEEMKDLYPGGLFVENRAGAAGRLAVETVKTADPDGTTLLYSPDSLLTILPHAIKAG